jgi:hypothetical protein
MRKPKFILGITLAMIFFGGFIMLESVLSGISHFTGKLSEDFKLYTFELQSSQAPLRTTFFSAKAGQLFTIWLRYSNRQIENKNIDITVSIVDEDENTIKKFERDLRFSDFRSGKKRVRYQKLGEYCSDRGFRGYMQYELGGTWTPTEASALILRKSPPLLLPLRQIGFFIIGIVAIIVGIDTIVKLSKKQKV